MTSFHPPHYAPYRPMKPVKDSIEDFSSVSWERGFWASPKIDGIRCVLSPQGPLSTSGRPISNPAVKELLADLPPGLDGELIAGSDPTHPQVYNRSQSVIMSRKRDEGFTFLIFDTVNGRDCTSRLQTLSEPLSHPNAKLVTHHYIDTQEKAETFFTEATARGYEGACYRLGSAPYKNGRAGITDLSLLRAKKFELGEAVILSSAPVLHNENAASDNAWGLTERSSHASGKFEGDYLGSLWVRDLISGEAFSVGTFFSLTISQRRALWSERDTLPGRIIRYRHHAHGRKDAPRQPIFYGFRSPEDLDLTC